MWFHSGWQRVRERPRRRHREALAARIFDAPGLRRGSCSAVVGDGDSDVVIGDFYGSQGAWLLAARHPDLVVAATRTEADWNLRQFKPVVWAPAKVSLDEGWLDGDQLLRTIMFAWSLDAVEVVVIGPSMTGLKEAPLRVRRGTLDAPLEAPLG